MATDPLEDLTQLAGQSPERRVAVARLLFAAGEVDQALSELDQVGSGQGSIAEEAVWVALQYRSAMGRFHEAFATPDLEGHKRAATLFASLADMAMGRGDAEMGLVHIQRALAHESSSASLHMARADALAASGAWDDARHELGKAVHISGDAIGYLEAGALFALRAGLFEDAERLAMRGLARDPSSTAGHDVLGHLALFRGDGEAAFRSAASLELAGARVVAAILQGGAFLLRGEIQGARRAIEGAIAASPDDAEALAFRAELRLIEGDRAGALVDADHAMAEAEGLLVSVLLIRALAHVSASDYPELVGPVGAIFPESGTAFAADDSPAVARWLRLALKAMAGNRTVGPSFLQSGGLRPLRFQRGPRSASRFFLDRIATSPPEPLLDGLETLARQHPDSGLPRCHRGELLLWLGRWDEARAELERVVREHPRTRWAYVGLAQAALHEGRSSDALAVIARGIERMGGTSTPSVRAVRGEALLCDGRPEEAMRDLLSAVSKSGSRISGWINLALAQEACGRIDEARASRKRVRQMAWPLLHDVARSCGARPDDDPSAPLLEAAREAMQGCRSSSIATWLARGSPLRSTTPRQTHRVLRLRQTERDAGLTALARLER